VNRPKIAKRIRERRLANALLQAELAERLDVSQGIVSFWETGRTFLKTNNF
jgi:transcriptional regulator with XRE-family HTH domain